MANMKLWQRKNGTWYITFKRGVHKSLKTKDRLQAEKVFKIAERKHLEGRLIVLRKGELKLLNDFITEYLDVRKIMAKNTIRADRLALEKFTDFYGNKTMAGISSKVLDKFKSFLYSQGLKETSINNHIRHLKGALRTAIKWEYITKNPMDDFKQFKVDKSKPVYMTKEEVKIFLSRAGSYSKEMQTAIAIMVYTGLSRAEIISPMNISEDSITYKRVKTKKPITVPIAGGLKPYISHLKTGIQKIVPWKNPRTFSKHFSNIVKAAKLNGISPHKIRHGFATHLYNDGVDLKTISELLGHSSIHITAEFYAHLEDEKKKNAVNKLDY